MALVVPPPNDKKRVKVYERRNNDWFECGTGFCTGRVINDESKVYVESEDQPERILLEAKISKDGGYQKKQETLIVWTDFNGTEMALSFQEAEGCAAMWSVLALMSHNSGEGIGSQAEDFLLLREFVSEAQQHLVGLGGPATKGQA